MGGRVRASLYDGMIWLSVLGIESFFPFDVHLCGMELTGAIDLLERIAPPDLAEEFDEGRIGLVVEGMDKIETVACALDATLSVVHDAVSMGASLLVVHHTPLWHPFTRVTGRYADLLRDVLAHELNIYVMHTNFDRAPDGINDALADLLHLDDRTEMSLGIVGTTAMDTEAMAGVLGGGLRVYGEVPETPKIGVVGGSGFDLDLIHEAVKLGADAFLSSELKHSVLRESPVPLIESTHYALESPGMKALAERMGWTYIEDAPGGFIVR